MISNINNTFTGILKHGITEIDVTNILKAIIFNEYSYLFESEPQNSFQMNNGNVIPINYTVISVNRVF
jgi:hypothetical protein